MELVEFLEQNGWTGLQSNLGVNHQAYEKLGWIVNVVNSYVSIRQFDRVVLATANRDEALGFLKQRGI